MRHDAIKLLLMLGLLSAAACSHEDDSFVEEDRGDPTAYISGERINAAVYIDPALPAAFASAVRGRADEIADSISDAAVAVTGSDGYGSVPDGKIAIICSPSARQTDSLGIGTEAEVLCVGIRKGMGGYCMVETPPEDSPLAASLNSVVSWVNNAAAASNAEDAPFGEEYVYPFVIEGTLDKEITHVALSKADRLKGSYTVGVQLKVTPLHGFSSSPGGACDYYLVTLCTTVESGKMYSGNFTKKHGGVKARICGYYLRSLSLDASIVNASDGQPVPGASFVQVPTPETVCGATTYSTSTNFSVSGALTAGTSPGATFKTGVTHTSSSTRTISDCDIANRHEGATAGYDYTINNLPTYNSAHMRINNPPLISTSTADFYSQWIWKAPARDKDDNTGFKVSVRLSDFVYGASYFYSSKADYHNLTFSLPDRQLSCALPVPNRWPTGRVELINNADSTYISDITFVSSIHKFTDPGIYGYKASSSRYLPVGKYTLKCNIKGADKQTKSCLYSKSVSVTEGGEVSLASSQGFYAQH